MSDRMEFTAEDEAAEQHGIKVAIARQELISQCLAQAAALLASGVEGARDEFSQDWAAIIETGTEVIHASARDLVDLLKEVD